MWLNTTIQMTVQRLKSKLLKLDDELAHLPTEQSLFLKIDVEGHELSVISGARKVLSRNATQAVILETNQSGMRYGISDDVLFNEMRSLGFIPCIFNLSTRELLTISKALPTYTNTIFIKNMADVCAKLKAAIPFINNSMTL